jgi:hypothetical protein
MPKQGGMAQLSRPFQIALVAVCLLAGVWLFALQGHSSSTSSAPASAPATPSAPAAASSPAASSATPNAAAEAKAAAAPTHVYHGAAPGVEGLSRAIDKAHGAVANSQQDAKQFENQSAEASGSGAPASTSAAAAAGKSASSTSASVTATTVHKTSSKSASGSTTVTTTTVHKVATKPGAALVPARQLAVEAALARGDMVVLLFWNRRGADDVAVHRALRPLAKRGSKIFVQEAPPSQVASFGSVTRGVQVYATPTILIVNKRGQTTTLTGLQDTYSILQAVAEARQP